MAAPARPFAPSVLSHNQPRHQIHTHLTDFIMLESSMSSTSTLPVFSVLPPLLGLLLLQRAQPERDAPLIHAEHLDALEVDDFVARLEAADALARLTGAHGERLAARGEASGQARGRVLKHEDRGRVERGGAPRQLGELGEALEVGLGVRLAVDALVTGDEEGKLGRNNAARLERDRCIRNRR